MDTINEEVQGLHSRRNFLRNVSIIGIGAVGSNFFSTRDVAAQPHHPIIETQKEKE